LSSGGGPAGLEAARVAVERGHAVRLVEAGPEVGGAFRLAGLRPRRSQILGLLEWYGGQLRRLGVTVRTNAPLDGEEAPGPERTRSSSRPDPSPAEPGRSSATGSNAPRATRSYAPALPGSASPGRPKQS
jgi:NADPH-dependent 2,4-dienoyl-CoA reductase/sulfur reductase-like enzyme